MSHDQDSVKTTHPFISFADFDFARLTNKMTWLLLGETMSKCQHLAHAPITPGLANKLARMYLVKGAQATTAIEGNTLSEAEVQAILDKGTADLGPSRKYQEQENKNILEAVIEIGDHLVQGHRIPITAERLCALNAQVLKDVPDVAYVVPGELRTMNVVVGPYQPPHWQDVPTLVKDFEGWLHRMRSKVSDESSTEDRFVVAFLTASLAHLYLAWIHPFGNGNGRTARLVEAQILAESGVVPLVSAQLMSNFFNLTRDAYYHHLNRARTDPDGRGVPEFIHYAIEGFADQLRDQIGAVQDQNLHIVWQSYVHEIFEHNYKHTEARSRQRKLAMAMPAGQAITPEQATDLNTELARLYARAEGRMPARDLNDLVKLGLVARVGKRAFRARRELIQEFLPPVFNRE
jgi:Fic family protein